MSISLDKYWVENSHKNRDKDDPFKKAMTVRNHNIKSIKEKRDSVCPKDCRYILYDLINCNCRCHDCFDSVKYRK